MNTHMQECRVSLWEWTAVLKSRLLVRIVNKVRTTATPLRRWWGDVTMEGAQNSKKLKQRNAYCWLHWRQFRLWQAKTWTPSGNCQKWRSNGNVRGNFEANDRCQRVVMLTACGGIVSISVLCGFRYVIINEVGVIIIYINYFISLQAFWRGLID